MNAYWVPSLNRFVRTQGEVPKGADFEKQEIDTSQQALIDRFNGYLNVPEREDLPPEPVPTPQNVPEREPVTIKLDEAFLAAPLGQQLSLAAIALEEARARIKP